MIPGVAAVRTAIVTTNDFWRRQGIFEIVAVLTLFLAILHGFRHWTFEYVAGPLVLAGLLYRPIRESWLTWGVIAVIATAVLLHNWYPVDNHKFLLVYWFWVLFLATLVRNGEEREKLLQFNARFFLVFVFLIAAAQKLASPSYVDGSFFELTVLTDSRFVGFMKLFGFDTSIMEESRYLRRMLKSPIHEVPGNIVMLPTTAGIALAATIITWWDVLVQVAIGALLVSSRRAIEIPGHILLLIFIFTTYFAAPVIGFGWTLSIMALVLVHGRFPALSLWYLASIFVLELYQVPWQRWVP